MLKIELKRAFCGKMYPITCLLGLAICIAQFFVVVLPSVQYLNFQANHGQLPNSVFNRWIGGYTDYFQIAYFAIFPILAVLPHGDTFYTDKNLGYIRQFYLRGKRIQYLKAKYIATFLSAGTAVTVPLVVNLLLTMVILPSIIPVRPSLLYPLSLPKSFLSEVFYSNPYLYVLIYLVLDFLIAGLLGGVALTVSFVSSNRYVPLLFPFAMYLFSSTLLQAVNLGGYSIMSFTNPAQPSYGTNMCIVLVELLIISVISLLFFLIGCKEDAY